MPQVKRTTFETVVIAGKWDPAEAAFTAALAAATPGPDQTSQVHYLAACRLLRVGSRNASLTLFALCLGNNLVSMFCLFPTKAGTPGALLSLRCRIQAGQLLRHQGKTGCAASIDVIVNVLREHQKMTGHYSHVLFYIAETLHHKPINRLANLLGC